MTTDLFTAAELITVLTVFCVVFCSVLCWAISGALPLMRMSQQASVRLSQLG
ncbi:MAG: hypothetical protein AAFR30_13230 [Cyanobacteria bacterium J06628_4]